MGLLLATIWGCSAAEDARTWHEDVTSCLDTGAPDEVPVPATEPTLAFCCADTAGDDCESTDEAPVSCDGCASVKVLSYQ